MTHEVRAHPQPRAGRVRRLQPGGDAAAADLTRDVLKKSPLALGQAKQTLNAAFFGAADVPTALRLEREVTARYCLTSEDAAEGLDAFAGKRAPAWSGR